MSTYVYAELKKLGPDAQGTLYVQLGNFPSHYLVLVITEEDFRYALISTQVLPRTTYPEMIMGDIGWLDVRRIHADQISITSTGSIGTHIAQLVVNPAAPPKELSRSVLAATPHVPGRLLCGRFRLETQVLRELYAYCWYATSPLSSPGY